MQVGGKNWKSEKQQSNKIAGKAKQQKKKIRKWREDEREKGGFEPNLNSK